MLRAVVKTFLETLTEREFDAPLLALLASQGFTDIHFIHGGFEFGKDVIAKRLDADGTTLRQYAIQSKSGDIGQAAWRDVRPQLEECEYNTRAHPSFDADLPRVAVLVTTGVLKGSAPVDSQEFRAACKSRGLADFDVWDQETILDWLCQEPTLGLSELQVQDDLVSLLSAIGRNKVTEPMLERHTRSWIVGEVDALKLGRASIEAAMIAHRLRDSHRLDLAALVSLHLYRAAWTPTRTSPLPAAAAALRLFVATASELLTQAEPLLGDPVDLAREVTDMGALFTYPAVCGRLVEIFSLLALVETEGDFHDRAVGAVSALASRHPGTARPPSDQFAAGILPTVTVLAHNDPAGVRPFLRAVSTWLLDRHDENHDGLGLGAIDEDERTQFERVVTGMSTVTSLDPRRSSYLAAVVLDALYLADAEDMYGVVRANMEALRIVITGVRADETHARWKRGGPNVHRHPRLEYSTWADRAPQATTGHARALDSVLLAAVARNRHYVGAYEELLAAQHTTAMGPVSE